ncbi:MAG: response regulator transcription factor, partial [Catalinimonas sp.]
DDHHVFRRGLIACVKEVPRLQVVQEAEDGQMLLDKIDETLPDVVLMDFRMPVMDGLRATETITKKHPGIRVLALSMYDDDQYIVGMMRAGAKGFLVKTAPPQEITSAVIAVYERGFYFNDRVSAALAKQLVHPEHLPAPVEAPDLNDRESDVLRLVCEELTSAEIADKLCLSVRTVEGYRSRLFEKTGAKNTAGLVLYAIRHNLFTV